MVLLTFGAAHASTGDVRIEQQFSGIPVFALVDKLCVHAVTVCGRELQPLGVEVGGTFTVRIENHYKSTYECAMIDGVATWVPTTVEGTCNSPPVVTLPAKYDETDAWNVG
ncbi:MAG: hypothetical protein WDO70_03370 [Alphaproteobacteria bacterium]